MSEDNKIEPPKDCLWCDKSLEDCTCIVDAIRRFDGMFGRLENPMDQINRKYNEG